MAYSVRVKNFASFDDSEVFELSEGVNVFTGINNAGKTALLWALAIMGAGTEPQRTWYQTLQNRLNGYMRPGAPPTVTVEFPLPARRRDALLSRICQLSGNSKFPSREDAQETFRFTWLADLNRNLGFRGEVVVRSRNLSSSRWDEFNIFQFQEGSKGYYLLHPFLFASPADWQPTYSEIRVVAGDSKLNRIFQFAKGDDILAPCWPSALSTQVLLEAQRKLNPFGPGRRTVELDPDAGNLAQVLATAQLTTPELTDGQERFQRIVQEMKKIFPEIQRIRTQVSAGQLQGQDGPYEVLLDLTHQRTVPLTHSGTGVQQILCLLTGAILQPRATTFLIDEPHSNLHPAAERSLLRLLETFGREFEHIFCITTQSGIIASHARRKLIAVTYRDEQGSKVRPLVDTADICALLGIENMDLFTYDKILFVEGPSDVAVLRRIFEFFDREGFYDRTKMVELSGDGKLRKSRKALDLIKLIVSASTSKVEVPVGLLLDSNDWSTDERKGLEKALNVRARSSVGFLEKPELEDYLLDADAIARVLAADSATFRLELNVDAAQVKAQLVESKSMRKGSARLSCIFSGLIEGHEFSKNRDCARIAEVILALNPDFLRPLYDEVVKFIGSIGSLSGAARAT
jgi:hypothetical protein